MINLTIKSVKYVFIKIGDVVKHSTLRIGKIQKIETQVLDVKFEDRISRFEINDFSKLLKKYFKEENIYKEYSPLTGKWLNEDGYDDEGFDVNGYDSSGFDQNGVHYIKRKPLKIYELIIDYIKEDINEDSFRNALVNLGQQTVDQILKEELRELYKSLRDIPNFWQQSIKNKIVSIKGWNQFSAYERSDRRPQLIPNKERNASCYECKGPLYSDVHKRCSKCGWLICPYDTACGCKYDYNLVPYE